MNDMTMAMPTVVVERVKRQRRPRTRDDRVFSVAVECWFEWLLMHYLPIKQVRVASGEPIVDVYVGFVRAARSNVEHSDSVLGAILAEERRGHAWPSSIHRIVLGFPRTWRMLLIGLGGNYSQNEIAEAIKIKQQHVSVMKDVMMMDFLPALIRLPNSELELMRRLGPAR